MKALLVSLLISSLPLLFSCTGPKSERCKQVCQLETDCAAKRKLNEEEAPYDLDECVAACIALERDSASRHLVEEHVACAEAAAGSCEKLMECR